MAEAYGVTDKGFVLKRYDEILEEIQNDVSDVVGFDVSQNPQSLINAALLVPFADKIASLWETAQDEYYAKYPSTASGINLDNACQYGNVYREGNRKSEYVIHVTAVDGTEIPKGSLIASNTNPTVSLQCAATTQMQPFPGSSSAISKLRPARRRRRPALTRREMLISLRDRLLT